MANPSSSQSKSPVAVNKSSSQKNTAVPNNSTKSTDATPRVGGPKPVSTFKGATRTTAGLKPDATRNVAPLHKPLNAGSHTKSPIPGGEGTSSLRGEAAIRAYAKSVTPAGVKAATKRADVAQQSAVKKQFGGK